MNNFTFKVFPAPTGPNRRAFQPNLPNWPKKKNIEAEQPAACPNPEKPPVLPPCPPEAPMPEPPQSPIMQPPMAPTYPPMVPMPEPPQSPIMQPPMTPPCPPMAPMPDLPQPPFMQNPMFPGFTPISPFYPPPGIPPYNQIPPQYPDQATYAGPPVRLAHAYVPPQTYNVVYSPAEALDKGTLFPELFQPQGIYGPCEGPNPCRMYFSWGGVPYGGY